MEHRNKQLSRERLCLAVKAFEHEMAMLTGADKRDYHSVVSSIHALCSEMAAAEAGGIGSAEMRQIVEPARSIHAKSPFVRRLQTWPRGYPGDYETIEHICECEVRAEPASAGYWIEYHALRDISAQQHRNKIAWQAQCILGTVLRVPHARVLSIACGGSRDLRSIEPFLAGRPLTVFLNDMDADALQHSLRHLPLLADCLHLIPGDVFSATRKFRSLEPLHLILAGGLFDYLDDRRIIWLLPKLFAKLAPHGRICFTNLARGNPDRIWLEYIADWRILERSDSDIHRLIAECGLASVSSVCINRDPTGLTQLVEIRNAAESA